MHPQLQKIVQFFKTHDFRYETVTFITAVIICLLAMCGVAQLIDQLQFCKTSCLLTTQFLQITQINRSDCW